MLGLSGNKIIFMKDKVRKMSSDKNNNYKLIAQMFKQKSFSDFSNEIYKTPKILGYGFIEECFYFDMELVEGENLINYMMKSYDDEILNRIVSFIQNIKSLNKNCDEQNFFRKMEGLKIFGYVDVNKIPSTYCHGDLTLENIIIGKDGDLWFIDFSETYYDSYFQDISKIMQELLLLIVQVLIMVN